MSDCQVCKRPDDGRVNHVHGHIFVGWGMGWQPCSACGGSGQAPDPLGKARLSAWTPTERDKKK